MSGDPTSLDPLALDPMTLDPMGLRGDAPLLDGYLRALEEERTPFIIPGHKRRADLVGPLASSDVPLYGGVDDVKQRGGLLAEAERRAAQLWGADLCRFSVGGSTHGNQALALAVMRPGRKVVVPRTLHRSLLSALVLTGAEPVWVSPPVDEARGLPLGVRAEQVEAALAAHPDVTAVVVGEPGYIGTFGDLGAVAALTRAADVPLVVDAAWAGHFGFGPAVPAHALALGADALVTSVHKALPGYSQAALVLARSERIDPGHFHAAVDATMTTSPAGSIMASIDATRALLERDGEGLVTRLVERVARARAALVEVEGLGVLDGPDVDPAKLVVQLPGTGAEGLAVEQDLIDAGMALENADRDTLVPMVTVADGDAEVDRLVAALAAAVERRRGEPRPVVSAASWTVRPETVMQPREAFFADHEAVPTGAAVGRVSAELIAPYPPGIPVLAPGERVTQQVVESLLAARDAGTRIAYAADPTLTALRVVR